MGWTFNETRRGLRHRVSRRAKLTFRTLVLSIGLSVLVGSSGAELSAQPKQSLGNRRSLASENLDAMLGSDTLVICPDEYRSALAPWLAYRKKQGHRITLVASLATAYENRKMIQKVAANGALKNVLIVGDSGDRENRAASQVPTDFVKARVNVQFGSDPEIATDNRYADLDGDGLPELSIGRMPVDSPLELTRQIKKIIRYETSNSNSEWQRRINFIAGVGGFGQLIDKLIEQTTKQMVTDLVPPAYKTSMTYGSWTSPYCPDPRLFSKTIIERFNEGCLFWVYIGHGSRHRLDKIYLPDRAYRILDCATCDQFNSRHGNPIAIFLACYTGAMDDPRDCLAEEMWARKNGPIAVVAGSRVTMPYAMSLFSLEMLREYFDGDVQTLGELIKVAKIRMANNGASDDPYRSMIEGMGKSFSPKPKLLAEERREHLHLMHLIGDPLLRLKRPQAMKISVPVVANAGAVIPVTGVSPGGGTYTVEVSYKRDRYRTRPPRRREYEPTEEAFDKYQVAYDNARQLVCLRADAKVVAGQFMIEVPLPANASGDCVVSVFNTAAPNIVMGSAPVFINAMKRKSGSASRSRKLK